jgi:aspartate racemase
MRVGLIVGIGHAATDFYHRRLVAALAAAGAPLELTMAHADTPTLLRNQMAGDAGAQVAIYLGLTKRLQAAGATVLAITSIAGHFCVGEFMAVSPLPVVNLLSVVDQDLFARGLRRVGVIGSRAVMESRFYGAAQATEIIPPVGEALQAMHDAYVAMASSESVTAAQREVFSRPAAHWCGIKARRRSCWVGQTSRWPSQAGTLAFPCSTAPASMPMPSPDRQCPDPRRHPKSIGGFPDSLSAEKTVRSSAHPTPT